MPQAEAEDEFKQSWESHIDDLVRLGNSLPEEDLEEFLEDVDDMREWVDEAADHSF